MYDPSFDRPMELELHSRLNSELERRGLLTHDRDTLLGATAAIKMKRLDDARRQREGNVIAVDELRYTSNRTVEQLRLAAEFARAPACLTRQREYNHRRAQYKHRDGWYEIDAEEWLANMARCIQPMLIHKQAAIARGTWRTAARPTSPPMTS
jgi:ribosomal protein L11 methylase PrmA